MRIVISVLVAAAAGLVVTTAASGAFDDELSPEASLTVIDMAIANHVLEMIEFRHDTEGKLVSFDSVLAEVDPLIRKRIPTRDGWGRALLCRGAGYGTIIVSVGADGGLDHEYDFSTRLPAEQVLRGDDIIMGPERPMKAPLTNRGRQMRTMADLRSIATAVESFAVDHNIYPGPTNGIVLVETMREQLEPTYIREIPRIDAWERPFLFWSNGNGYIIVSLGSDGVEDVAYEHMVPPLTGLGRGATSGYEWDIVFVDGQFVQWPEGAQQ